MNNIEKRQWEAYKIISGIAVDIKKNQLKKIYSHRYIDIERDNKN